MISASASEHIVEEVHIEEEVESNTKRHLNVVFIGHVGMLIVPKFSFLKIYNIK